MIPVYSSSSELQERSASSSYRCSMEDLGGDDDDYVMEGESWAEKDIRSYSSTEIPDDENVDELTESSAKTPEFPGEKTPEDETKGSPEIKLSNFRLVVSWIRLVLLTLVVSVVILALCLHIMAGTINEVYDNSRLIIPKVTLESVSVFPIQLHPVSNSTERNITAGWNMIFNVGNPSENHVLSFSDFAAEVYYGKNAFPLLPVVNKITLAPWITVKPIWKTVVPGFNQPQAHQDLVKVTFDSIPVSIDNATATSLAKVINSVRSWGFSVQLHGNITQKNPEEELERDHSTGSFTALCPLHMAFLQTGGVMAASSQECKVLRGGLDGWMGLAIISDAFVHGTRSRWFYLSRKCWPGFWG